MTNHETRKSGTQSLERALSVLQLIGNAGVTGVSVPDICETTGLNQATVYRNLQALQAHALVTNSGGRYCIGRGALFLAASAFAADPLHEVAIGPLRRVAQATNCSVTLLVSHGYHAMCAARVEGTFSVKMIYSTVGAQQPLGIGPGSLCLLAGLDDATVEEVLTANRSHLIGKYFLDELAIRETIDKVRRERCARDPGIIDQNTYGLGVPVFDAAGKTIAAVGISLVRERIVGDRESKIISLMRSAATEIGSAANPVTYYATTSQI